MFGHKHYLPIVKTKLGEFWALKHLKAGTRGSITPILELDNLPRPRKPKTPPKKPSKPKTLADHLKTKMLHIVDSWGVGNKFFLDAVWIKDQANDHRIVTAVFDAARLAGLHAIPVVTLDHDVSVLRAVGAIASKDKRGVMLRVTPDQIQRPHLIDAVLKEVSLSPKQVHLLLDYRVKQMELDVDVVAVPHLASWETFSAASGAFPASLAGRAQKVWHDISRTDWRSWSKSIRAKKLKRMPAFADYTVRAFGAPAEGGNPPVVIRYTCENKWIVRLDGYHMDGDSPEMKAICQSLVKHPEFYGRAYSAGDKAIQDIADAKLSTGGPSQWVQYAVNHHVEVVVQENLPSV